VAVCVEACHVKPKKFKRSRKIQRIAKEEKGRRDKQ
jgi:hypothetical protein